jgi:hypothetical protein
LLQAEKIPVVRHVTLRCEVPYALEGWLRRELPVFGALLLDARHGDGVSVDIQVPEPQATAFIERLNDAGQGRVIWPEDPDRDSELVRQ